MSKIGKKLVPIPQEVKIEIDGNSILVQGPKGELRHNISKLVMVTQESGNLVVRPRDERLAYKNKKILAMWGLTRALLSNMVKGVTEGFEKRLEFEGVGYKANVKPARPDNADRSGGGNDLELSLGYSHPVSIKAPPGISLKVEKNVITIMGIDKDLVGKVAAEIKSQREPEPYKGSGIKYQGEIIIRKAGKKAATAV